LGEYEPLAPLPAIDLPPEARTVPTGAPRFVYGEAEAA
jgi:lysine 2,3-aminomutase